MILELNKNWQILQDVHDSGEQLGLYQEDFSPTMGNQVSEWEELAELKHLQLLYASQPYFGRELRYFNQAPWWYRRVFDMDAEKPAFVRVCFTNVDYYCKVWLNGQYIGEHEGYSVPFSFELAPDIVRKGKNTLIVKVSSPWDDAVDDDRQDRRTFRVMRRMVKGTYEHSDTFVQRDVNPIGIYGKVTIEYTNTACFKQQPEVWYELDDALQNARLHAKAAVGIFDKAAYALRLRCVDTLTKETVADVCAPLSQTDETTLSAEIPNVHLWNTWDMGGAWLYETRIDLIRNGEVEQTHAEKTGFRSVVMERTPEKTAFLLNGRGFYVRGTSYFADAYVSNMSLGRYKRDLLAIRAAGFNLVRVHVHVELPAFYELCSELGIAVLQDSEYNWTHPATDEFADRFIGIYLKTIAMLKRHAAIFSWICMNEPGLEDPAGDFNSRAMTVNPGPKLAKAVLALDPSRPIIKGSFCADDPQSGDSHNYIGSLCGNDGHYSEIFGTYEKLNTEYGFDAPCCIESMKLCPPILKRLKGIEPHLEEIYRYQYCLLKYYTEHYRMQKHKPNEGYVQFLFIDMCPQSFYGLYDWWGIPKPGLDAMLESNMPVGIFLRYNANKAVGIYAVNDQHIRHQSVKAQYIFTDGEGKVLDQGEKTFDLTENAAICLWELDIASTAAETVNCALVLTSPQGVLASNHYEDLFNMPKHVEGHPERMSHEIGMRLFAQ